MCLQKSNESLSVSEIVLLPNVVDCIAFWTKELPVLDKMRYQYYFQFTLTPYEKSMEHNLRDKCGLIDTFINVKCGITPNNVRGYYTVDKEALECRLV